MTVCLSVYLVSCRCLSLRLFLCRGTRRMACFPTSSLPDCFLSLCQGTAVVKEAEETRCQQLPSSRAQLIGTNLKCLSPLGPKRNTNPLPLTLAPPGTPPAFDSHWSLWSHVAQNVPTGFMIRKRVFQARFSMSTSRLMVCCFFPGFGPPFAGGSFDAQCVSTGKHMRGRSRGMGYGVYNCCWRNHTNRPNRHKNTDEATDGTKDGIILNGGYKHKTEIQTDLERSADRTADS